jgi:hypothetical protein
MKQPTRRAPLRFRGVITVGGPIVIKGLQRFYRT